MLRELEIVNYALIAHARVEFAPGATMFTGETGSGKTMLLGALEFVLGERAGPDIVRRGASKAAVSMRFDPDEALRERLAADGFELDADEDAILGRDMSDAGRTSLRINGRPCSASYIRDIGDAIAQIVRQQQARRLLSSAYHRALLDAFAGSKALRAGEDVAQAHAALEIAKALLAARQGDERLYFTRYEDARYALAEIEAVRPEIGELEQHRQRQRYLTNLQRISGALGRAHDALSSEEGSAIAALGDTAAALSSIADLDPAFAALAESSTALQSQANDVAAAVARAFDGEVAAGELDAVNARLEALERLQRKYGGTVEAVLDRAMQARTEIDGYENRDRVEAELRSGVAGARQTLREAADRLSAARATAAPKLSAAVRRELSDLALGSGRFETALQPEEPIGPQGAERVEFQFAANAGEPARPLERVASGGELSRLLLGLIVVLSDRSGAGALVFDEIDTGIGGATAAAVGTRIGRLAQQAQVVCVTHLAQIAAWSDRHYVLEKHESDATTTISIREVSGPKARAEELARMLSGEKHEVALEHARRLLSAARGSANTTT